MNDLRYPIGVYQAPDIIDRETIEAWIVDIEQLPARLRKSVKDLTEDQLNTVYRPGGWTVRQVVHHLADSHMNSYVRFRWTLTEDNPTIKAYREEQWAELADARVAPIEWSLDLLQNLHKRWVYFLRTLSAPDLKKTFIHPESAKKIRLDWNIGLYAWHGDHHLAHITRLKERNNWK